MDLRGKILLVDDEQENLDDYSKIFRDAGYEVNTAINTNETFSNLNKSLPDLVLLDVNLGTESGFDILEKIKSQFSEESVYVVLIFGLYNSSDDPSNGLELGADGYFSRPIEKRELLARVEAYMRHKRTINDLKKSEQRLHSIISAIPLPLYIWRKKEGRFFLEQYIDAAHRELEREINKAVGVRLEEFYGSEEDIIQTIRNAFERKTTIQRKREYSSRTSDKSRMLNVMCTYVPPDYVMLITQDITQEENVNKQLHIERNKATNYLNIAASIILALDSHGTIQLLNDSGANILECDASDVIGKSWFETFIPEDSLAELKRDFLGFVSGGYEYLKYHDYDVLTSTGKRRTIHWYNNLIYNEEGVVTGVLSSGEDISNMILTSKALRKSENKYAELFMNLQNGLIIFEYSEELEDFIISNANETGIGILNLNLSSFGRNAIKEIFPPIINSGLWDTLLKVRKTGVSEKLSVAYYSENCLDLYTENNVYKLPSGEIVLVFNDITKGIQSEEELKKSLLDIKKLTEKIELVREEERKEIASNLHDDLGQLLTAIKMDLGWLKNNVPFEEAVFRKRLASGNEIIDQAIRTVQRISSELRPPVLDNLGLLKAVEQFISDFKSRTNIDVRVELPREDIELPGQYSISIYRMIQESFTNIARHSKAKKAVLLISKKSNTLEINIEDDGIGIAEKSITSSNSLGIIGMREKVLRCNGDFNIVGNREKGTALNIKLPIIL